MPPNPEKRYDAAHVAKLLVTVTAEMRPDLKRYEKQVPLSPQEEARALLWMILFPTCVADSWVRDCDDQRCQLTFVEAYFHYLRAFPGQDEDVQLDNYVLQGYERDLFIKIFTERFCIQDPDLIFMPPTAPKYQWLLRGMMLVRQEQYAKDTEIAVRTSPRPGDPSKTMTYAFKIFGDEFTRSVLTLDGKNSTRYHASVAGAALMFGRTFFRMQELLSEL